MIDKFANLSFKKLWSSNPKSLGLKKSNKYSKTGCNTTNVGVTKILAKKYFKAWEQSTQSHPLSSIQVTLQCDGSLFSIIQLLGTLVSNIDSLAKLIT
jgi:hypothetical protein